MGRLVLAVDGTEHSDRAAALAGHLSEHLGATVDVVHVVEPAVVRPSEGVREYGRIEHVVVPREELVEAAGRDVVVDAAARVRAARATPVAP